MIKIEERMVLRSQNRIYYFAAVYRDKIYGFIIDENKDYNDIEHTTYRSWLVYDWDKYMSADDYDILDESYIDFSGPVLTKMRLMFRALFGKWL